MMHMEICIKSRDSFADRRLRLSLLCDSLLAAMYIIAMHSVMRLGPIEHGAFLVKQGICSISYSALTLAHNWHSLFVDFTVIQLV